MQGESKKIKVIKSIGNIAFKICAVVGAAWIVYATWLVIYITSFDRI
jgi:hypothetical protein